MKLAVIGAGAMGGAVARGLLKQHLDDVYISVSNPSPAKLADIGCLGAATTTSNVAAAKDADMVILAVKPWLVQHVLCEIATCLDDPAKILAVIAAGISTEQLQEMLSEKAKSLTNILLVMPNTAMEVGKSMTFVVPSPHASESAVALTCDLFDKLGHTMVIPEKQLPAATALASCGIAYAMRYVRAAVEGGVELGVKAAEAQQMVVNTLIGAAALLSVDGAHPEAEIDKVTTPGGITIKGLNEMERSGFSTSVINGLRASCK